MGKKGNETKRKVAEAARPLFSAKGFYGVTMQDVCEAAGLSRGGLYRHFSGTGEILEYLVTEDQEEALASLRSAKANGVAPHVIFDHFLRSRVRTFLSPETNTDNVWAEYAGNSEHGREFLRATVTQSIEILTEIIHDCVSEGCFQVSDARAMAIHILWTLEGLSKHCALLTITNQDIEEQIRLIYALLTSAQVPEKEN